MFLIEEKRGAGQGSSNVSQRYPYLRRINSVVRRCLLDRISFFIDCRTVMSLRFRLQEQVGRDLLADIPFDSYVQALMQELKAVSRNWKAMAYWIWSVWAGNL